MNKAYKDNENKKCSQIEEVPKTFLTRTQKLADKADYTIYKLGFKFCWKEMVSKLCQVYLSTFDLIFSNF